MATGKDVWFDNDARSVHVDLLYSVEAKQVALVDGWLGITEESGDSGDMIALTVDDRAYQFEVPAALSVSKGNIVYVTIAEVTGHTLNDDAYSTSAGSGKVAFFKAIEDKDANNVVVGKMLSGFGLAS